MLDRRRPDARHAGGRLPRVRAADRGDPDSVPRPLADRSRSAGDHPARAGARRPARPGHHALEVGHGPVVGQDDLQARRRSDAGAAARPGGARPRDRGDPEGRGAAGHAAAALGDRPLHEDRLVVEEAVGGRPVDDRLLDDPAAAARRAGRRERRDLGRADRDAAGPGRARRACGRTASRSSRSWRPRRTRWKRG